MEKQTTADTDAGTASPASATDRPAAGAATPTPAAAQEAATARPTGARATGARTTGARTTGARPAVRRRTPPLASPWRPTGRQSGPLPSRRAQRRYWLILAALALLSAGAMFGSLAWDNPMPVGSRGFWLIAQMRATNLVVIVVVAFCQAIATVSFQTVTNNRILTPSIMGFESLYILVQTGAVFFIGLGGIAALTGLWQFLLQIGLMVGFAAALYGWLLAGRRGNLHITLLVGIVLGGGLGAASTFMQRLLTPSEFDVLTARLIGSIATADTEYLWVSIPLAALAGGALWLRSSRLNVLALGRETAINLGINHRRQTIVVLLLVAVLMAISTALVGPMTFLGFLVAMIAYQLADTYDHRFIFPLAWLVGIVVLAGSHFVLKNLFYAEGSVGIIIEIVGGSFFLFYILRKGRL
ncbi:iron chelate uptake ABC transporter family permease subunit [Brevibacterium salitolerans]|uniref:Iron chelate uptake ABC transporter family permease subunit n=1 Tax=Brevibacterium salitolerans TaxID=1403566 RepID=A0ABN2WTZ8_9MICO